MSIKKPTEQGIVNACLDLLAWRKVVAWRVNCGAVKVGKRLVRFNHADGCSDILGALPHAARFIAVEVKRPGLGKRSRPTDDQQVFLDNIRRQGGLAVCVTSVAELDALLTLEGY